MDQLMRLHEDLGNLAQVDPDILKWFKYKGRRAIGSTSRSDFDVSWSGSVGSKSDNATSRLAQPLSNNATITASPFIVSGKKLKDCVQDNLITIFVANGDQVGFISRMGVNIGGDDTLNGNWMFHYQFIKTRHFDLVFSEENFDERIPASAAMLLKQPTYNSTEYEAERQRRQADGGYWSDPRRDYRRRGKEKSSFTLDKVYEYKAFAEGFRQLCLNRGVECSLLLVSIKQQWRSEVNPHRPPMPGEPDYETYMKSAKEELQRRLDAFKAKKTSFTTEQDLLSALRSGSTGLDRINVFGVPYVLDEIDTKNFGDMIAKAYGYRKKSSYDAKAPVPDEERVKTQWAIKFTRMRDTNDKYIGSDDENIPVALKVHYKIEGMNIVVSHVEKGTSRYSESKVVKENDNRAKLLELQNGFITEVARFRDPAKMKALYDNLYKLANREWRRNGNGDLPRPADPFKDNRDDTGHQHIDVAIADRLCRVWYGGAGPNLLSAGDKIRLFQVRIFDNSGSLLANGELREEGTDVAVVFVQEGLSTAQMDEITKRIASRLASQAKKKQNQQQQQKKGSNPPSPANEGTSESRTAVAKALMAIARKAISDANMSSGAESSMASSGRSVNFIKATDTETTIKYGIVIGPGPVDQVMNAANSLMSHWSDERSRPSRPQSPQIGDTVHESSHIKNLKRLVRKM